MLSQSLHRCATHPHSASLEAVGEGLESGTGIVGTKMFLFMPDDAPASFLDVKCMIECFLTWRKENVDREFCLDLSSLAGLLHSKT